MRSVEGSISATSLVDLRVYVDLLCDCVVPRCAGFAVESQNLYDLVLVYVDNTDRPTECVDDVNFAERCSIGHPIRL